MTRLQSFLLEMGHDLSFVARQMRASTETSPFYLDPILVPFYRNAVPSQSLGLSRRAYPGASPDPTNNPLGIAFKAASIPGVAGSQQPRALIRNPFGITEGRFRCVIQVRSRNTTATRSPESNGPSDFFQAAETSSIANYDLEIPSLDDQRAISKHVQELHCTLKTAKRRVASQIQSLKTLRSTLIGHAVTGRIKINDAQR